MIKKLSSKGQGERSLHRVSTSRVINKMILTAYTSLISLQGGRIRRIFTWGYLRATKYYLNTTKYYLGTLM